MCASAEADYRAIAIRVTEILQIKLLLRDIGLQVDEYEAIL